MFKKSNAFLTVTYEVKDNYFLDLVTKEDSYEAWIYNSQYGIKTMIYGVPRYQNTKEEFLEILEETIDEDINFYKENYER